MYKNPNRNNNLIKTTKNKTVRVLKFYRKCGTDSSSINWKTWYQVLDGLLKILSQCKGTVQVNDAFLIVSKVRSRIILQAN